MHHSQMFVTTTVFTVFCLISAAAFKTGIKEYSLSYLIQENDPIRRMVGTIVTDIGEAGFILALHKSLTFRFSSPNCCFEIDEKTSVLSIASSIDLESVCASREMSSECSSGQGNLELIVNLWSNRQLVAVIRVKMSVLDVNDNIPQFKKSHIERRVSEASHKSGHSIFLETAFDSDISPENARIEYGLSEHHSVFQLRLDQLRQPFLLLMRDLDAEIQTHFQLKVRAWNVQNHKMWNELVVNIFVVDSNDNAPKFNMTTFTVMVKENTPAQTSIFQLVAHDPDSSSILVFGLYQDANQELRNLFSIFQNGTVIVISGGLDYERYQRYQVPVIVTDGLYEARAVLQVLLEDENDEKPQIIQNPSVIEVVENGGTGLLIGQVMINDKDGPHTNGKIICQHQAGQAGLTFLQSSARNLINLIYDIRTEISFDREKLSQVLVVLVCSDGWNSSSGFHLTSSFTITVNILDINDNYPQFQQPQYTAHIVEDSPLGTSVIEVNADDLDVGINGKIIYALDIDLPVFNIDSSTGLITVQGLLDREMKDQYTASVLAIDSGTTALTTSVSLVIFIDDANDHTPSLLPPFELAILENSGPKQIGQLRHEDGDIGPNAEVVYSRLWPNDDLITVSDNGTIFATRSLDREAKNRHCLRVTLRDKGIAGRRQSSGEVCVKVMDVNDNKPRLINPLELRENDDATTPALFQSISLSIYESPGHMITQLVAVDDDESHNARITYQIKLPDILPAKIFTLNASSGHIVLARPLSHKYLGIYPIRVYATDSGSPALSDEKTFHLHITNQPASANGKSKSSSEISWMDRNNLFVVIILSCITLSFIGMFITAIACMLKPCCQRNLNNYDQDWVKKLAPGRPGTLKATTTQDNISSSLQENLLVNGSSDISGNFLNACLESDIDMKPFGSLENQIYTENEYFGYNYPNSTLHQYHGARNMTGKNPGVSRLEYGIYSQCPTMSTCVSHAYATFGHYIDVNNDEEIKEDFQSDSGRGASEDDASRTNIIRLKLAGQTSTFKDCSLGVDNANIQMVTINAKMDPRAQIDICQQTTPSNNLVKPDVLCDEINQLFFNNLIK